LHRDAVRVKAPDDLAVFRGFVVALVGGVEARPRNRFQAEEQRLAPTPGRSSSNAASAVHWLVHQRLSGAIAANSSLA
jgi:hypothetical protein